MIDFFIADKAAEMIRSERFPRFLYKKGITVEGTFSPYMNLSEYTTAELFANTENDIPVTVRFSKVFGEVGEGDTVRDIISIAVRFFTNEGHFDMIAHNIKLPDALRTPSNLLKIIELFKKKADTAASKDNLFIKSLENEALTSFLIDYYSDLTTVKSYSGIEGYVLNDYLFKDACGVPRTAVFKWIPENGIMCISRSEAEFFAGYEPDIAAIDICERLERNEYLKFDLETNIAGKRLMCGKLCLKRIAKNTVNDSIQFTPSNLVSGAELADTDFNKLTVFMYNEAIRLRGGII